MREIKFRAWDKVNNRMLFGYEPEEQGKREYYPICFGIGFSTWSKEDLIIEQFTGLHDKHNKEIYEGDICKQDWSTPPYEPIIVVVKYGEYRDAGFGITCERNEKIMGWGLSPTWDRLNDRYEQKLEIIGNIHENPELLK